MVDAPFPDAEWFKFSKRARFGSSVWVPLYSYVQLQKVGDENRPGFREEIRVTKSIALQETEEKRGDELQWMDFDVSEGPWAGRDGTYQPSETWRLEDDTPVGVNLVFCQNLPGCSQTVWHISQDLVLALGLIREGDSWLRPSEGFVEVVRMRRGADDNHVAIEIRREFLCDYLAARRLFLELASYQERTAITGALDEIPDGLEEFVSEADRCRIETQIDEIDATGDFVGTSVAVFTARRTDVDHEEDVPVFDRESNENTKSESYSFTRASKEKHFRVWGMCWAHERIQHAGVSERVRRDSNLAGISYVTGATGDRTAAEQLDREDVGRYLWFRPGVIADILSIRGSSLVWHTRFTGTLFPNREINIHFGVNEQGSISTYAYDVASLPSWLQRVFVGFNIAPSGPPCSELLSAQMECRPANTIAPEISLQHNLSTFETRFSESFGRPLLHSGNDHHRLFASLHRFKANDSASFLALAKDIARVVVDGLDKKVLRELVESSKKENLGSLKLLERLVATKSDAQIAASTLSPLFGLYDLRLADAHPTSKDLQSAYSRVAVESDAPVHIQSVQLFDSISKCLADIADQISGE